MNREKLFDKVYGALLGGIIGDAMGAPGEGKTWRQSKEQYGYINDFEGVGTDDSAIKQILCEAIIENNGFVTADDFAASFLKNKKKYMNLFFVPVKNMVYKLECGLATPVEAGYGNMHSSSSAMSISPMGILHACNPRRAAFEAFDVAGLIHSGPAGFCRDAACSIAAAVAEAMKPDTTVDAIVQAGSAYLHQTSAQIMLSELARVLGKAKGLRDYEKFRDWFYENCLRESISDSRETVPCTLALFYLAEGDPARAIPYAANFGRDADTIATMVGAIAGAYKGASGLPSAWVQKLEAASGTRQKVSSTHYDIDPFVLSDQKDLADSLIQAIQNRVKDDRRYISLLEAL